MCAGQPAMAHKANRLILLFAIVLLALLVDASKDTEDDFSSLSESARRERNVGKNGGGNRQQRNGKLLGANKVYRGLTPGRYRMASRSVAVLRNNRRRANTKAIGTRAYTFTAEPNANCLITVKCPCGRIHFKNGNCVRVANGPRQGECSNTLFVRQRRINLNVMDNYIFECRIFCVQRGQVVALPPVDCGGVEEEETTTEPPTTTTTTKPPTTPPPTTKPPTTKPPTTKPPTTKPPTTKPPTTKPPTTKPPTTIPPTTKPPTVIIIEIKS